MKFYTFSLLLYLVILCIYPSFSQSQLPLVQVQGNSFVLENGEKIVFQGLNTSDPDKLDKEGQWNDALFKEMKDWGANMIRFPIHPRAWRARGEEAYINLIKEGIKLAEQNGLYVILDWHSIGNLRSELFQAEMYNTTKRETFEFWRAMARNFGENTTVAFFELFNEPTTYNGQLGISNWEDWKEIIEEIIVIIRAHDAKNIPLVAGFNWAYDLTPVKNKPIEAEGIAYVSHPYPQKRLKPWEEKWEKDWGFISDTYPLILTEIGFCGPEALGAHIPVISDASYVDSILKYADKKGISYCVWVFDPQWSPMLIKDWTFEPTEAGAVWKTAMQKNKVDK